MNYRILIDAILGTLRKEDAEELRRWRQADTANEATYRQSVDTDLLNEEYRWRQMADPSQALAEMQQRIAALPHSAEGHPNLAHWRWAAAVALVAAIGALSILYIGTRVGENEALAPIRAGEPRATMQLATADGHTPLATYHLAMQPSPEHTLRSIDAEAFLNRQAIRSHQSLPSSATAPRFVTLTTPRGGEFGVTLPDGTEVWLNAESRLVYPELFQADERHVYLQGEAYFRVTHDASRPFCVETVGQTVSVLGTEFNVRCYADEPIVETTLVAGSVAISPDGATGSVQLLPGEQALLAHSNGRVDVHNVDTQTATSWRQGKFTFENQTLSQIMLTLSRWYDFAYTFADERAAQTMFMGRVPRYADFADVLDILQRSGGLRFSVDGRHVTIASN